MNSYTVKLIDKKEVAKDTISFYFQKPKDFNYVAGQYGDWFLPQVPKGPTETGIRSFTLCSAPFEDNLMITTRMRNTAFKNELKTMPIGSEIILNGPEGDFTLPDTRHQIQDTSNPFVFIAGGIGITPFRSIITQCLHDSNLPPIFLFYSNHYKVDAAFLDWLMSINNLNFHFIPIFTKEPNWTGEKKRIDLNLISQSLNLSISQSLFYLAGPPAMVFALRDEFKKEGINEKSILVDDFTGY